MKTNTLQFRLEGFRAVHKACIDLKGMTVLTGPGGSGKTTLANYLHRLIYGLGVYEERAGKIPQKEMFGVEDILYDLVISFFPYKFRNIMKYVNSKNPLSYQGWKKLLKKLRETYEQALLDYPQIIKSELWKICPDEIDHLLEEMKLDLSPEGIDFPTLIDHLEAYLELLKEKSDHIVNERPISYFYEVMHYFPDNLLSSSWFSLQQGRKTVIAKGQDSIGKLVPGQKSYFINSDTFGYPVFEEKLPELHPIPDRILAKLQEVIQGELVVRKVFSTQKPSEEKFEYIYRRKDGVELSPQFCESSLQPFLYLYRLLLKGSLDKKTLLVFDQPGLILGSGRITPFACLICEIYQHLQTKFLLAVDLKEMTAALDAAVQGYGLDSHFRIYEAHESEEPFQYDFLQVI